MSDPRTPPADHPPRTPPADHPQFEALCAEVGDYEHLPAAPPAAAVVEDHRQTIDAEILAGLVSP